MWHSAKYIDFSFFLDLDRVSFINELSKTMPAERIVRTVLLVTLCRNKSNNHAVLYHCQIDDERRTFLKGNWCALGLSEYSCMDVYSNSTIAWAPCAFNNYS